jgi:formylglycine-generating enzyme required for sulfatase activity
MLSMTGTNNANYDDPILGFTNPPDYLTPVGSFASSPGAYGTFDQGGDVMQWNEDLVDAERVVRGGSYNTPSSYLESSTRLIGDSSADEINIGFRIAEVPEPGSLGLLAVGIGAMLIRRRRNPPAGIERR